MVVSGGLLFAAQSAKIYENVFLRAKLLLLVLALLNVALFHSTTYRNIRAWSGMVTPPTAARVFASVSLLLWTGVIVTGRFIAYFLMIEEVFMWLGQTEPGVAIHKSTAAFAATGSGSHRRAVTVGGAEFPP